MGRRLFVGACWGWGIEDVNICGPSGLPYQVALYFISNILNSSALRQCFVARHLPPQPTATPNMPSASTTRTLALASAAVAVSLSLYFLSRPKKSPKHEVVFVLGGPGAGKGTQCDKLIEQYPQVSSMGRFTAGENTTTANARCSSA